MRPRRVAVRAITVYGKCYDARTNQLAASLGKAGRGPLMGATGNFREFQKALDDFTAKALAATDKRPERRKLRTPHSMRSNFDMSSTRDMNSGLTGNRALSAEESAEYC